MTVIEILADWAANVPSKHPDTALQNATLAIEDVIGCIIAGINDEAVVRVRNGASRWNQGAATIVGCSNKLAAPWAALVNGTAAHALDFDDEFLPALTHASAVLAPALLALGEERNSTGASILDAYIVGIELQAALGRGLNRSHYDMGWHATSTIGTIGAAGACARLMGLNVSETAHALSLGISMAGGPKVQFGSMAKPLHAGLAAQHGIEAAVLAAAGVEGRLDALEGPMGFLHLYGGPSPAGWDSNLRQLGDPLAIENDGLMAKRFPCCTASHRVLECILNLREEKKFQANDVVSVDALIGHGHKKNLMYDNPKTEVEARFSLQYCVAVALQFGDVVITDFIPPAVHRPEVQKLLDVTRVRAHKPGAEQVNSSAILPHEVTVELKDGQRFHACQTALKGSVGNPLSQAERETKFRDCCNGFVPDKNIGTLRKFIMSIGSMDDIGALFKGVHRGLV
jgi:2-methylcitrate dehydratase PrpD